ncbi:hypothetical protein EYC84_007585 [Monilinia fructicola]|uniref:Uncharacterized protein n=1 Tax=Monilinia fructicola TaxID=38448 RepID=A0A5M9JIM1_MONFR|nr:hypothetical protein EYC84_007585 [Monilinia fructicola]
MMSRLAFPMFSSHHTKQKENKSLKRLLEINQRKNQKAGWISVSLFIQSFAFAFAFSCRCIIGSLAVWVGFLDIQSYTFTMDFFFSSSLVFLLRRFCTRSARGIALSDLWI